MANNQLLLDLIDSKIYTNAEEEVTAQMVNDVATAITEHFGSGYVYCGLVTPTSIPNSNTDVNCFYFASEAGTYTNFGSLAIDENLAIIKYNGTYSKESIINIAEQADIVQATGQSETKVMSQKASTDLFIQYEQNELTKFATGFNTPLDVIITGDTSTRKVTITGDCDAYWRGVQVASIVSGYLSPAHGTDTTKKYYLFYNGTSIAWSEDIWTFDMLQIALTYYDNEASEWVYIRECHGLVQDPETHKNLHINVGTYKESGGTISSYTLDSTTETNRRPVIGNTYINDEDLQTLVLALTTNSYTRLRLNGSTGACYFTRFSTEIVNLSANQPYYNEWTGSTWQETLMPANSIQTIWIYAQQTCADTGSQAHRFLLVQGQSITQATNSSSGAITTAVNNELLKTTQSLNLGSMITAEMVCIGKILIAYTSNNWRIKNVSYVTGNRTNQSSTASGNFLTGVATDESLNGNGTTPTPLSNTWIEKRTTATTSSNTPVLSIDPTYRRIYYTITGGTGDATISLANYTIVNNRTLVIIKNTRGTDVKIVFPTANLSDSGITYVIHKMVNDVTAKNGYTCEFELLFDSIDATNTDIRISAQAFDNKSS